MGATPALTRVRSTSTVCGAVSTSLLKTLHLLQKARFNCTWSSPDTSGRRTKHFKLGVRSSPFFLVRMHDAKGGWRLFRLQHYSTHPLLTTLPVPSALPTEPNPLTYLTPDRKTQVRKSGSAPDLSISPDARPADEGKAAWHPDGKKR